MDTENSIIDIVDSLIYDAIEHLASDIHLESQADALRVRWRIDGVLYDKEEIEALFMAQVLSRIKVLAHIDITEKRIPHDGKFKVLVNGQEIDLRVSSFPSIYGEKIVIRILDRAHHMITLEHLGFTLQMLDAFKTLLSRSSGFFFGFRTNWIRKDNDIVRCSFGIKFS